MDASTDRLVVAHGHVKIVKVYIMLLHMDIVIIFLLLWPVIYTKPVVEATVLTINDMYLICVCNARNNWFMV